MEELPIGIRIKNLRESQGLNKKAFAEKHNLEIDNYYKWEKGTNPSDPEDYKKLERILNNAPPPANEDKLSDIASRFLKMLESQQRTIEHLAEKRRRAPNRLTKNVLPSSKTKSMKRAE